jgi:hypothetical protein
MAQVTATFLALFGSYEANESEPAQSFFIVIGVATGHTHQALTAAETLPLTAG